MTQTSAKGASSDTITVRFLQGFADAFNAHDVKAILSYMTDDCVFEASAGPDANGETFVGKDAAGKAFEAVWKTCPDAHWGNAAHFIAGDRGVSQWLFTGTKADGSRVEVTGCDLFTFREGKIAIKNSYRKNRPLVPPVSKNDPGTSRTTKWIRASKNALFQAFPEASALQTWLPPEGMTGKVHRFVPGGGGGYEMSLYYTAADHAQRGKTQGNEDRVKVRFDLLEPPSRLVQTALFDSRDPAFAGEMRMTVTFESERDGTKVAILCEQIPPGIRPEDNDAGCRSSLENLARFVA